MGIFKSACQFLKKWVALKKTGGKKVLGASITSQSIQGGGGGGGWMDSLGES